MSVGASGWQYMVAYQPDVERALQDLRQRVFEDGAWWWYADHASDPDPPDVERPDSLEELWENEYVQELGTHSIIDVFRIAAPGEVRPQTVVLTDDEEADFATGITRPATDHVDDLIDGLAEERWVGRAAILYDHNGTPTRSCFGDSAATNPAIDIRTLVPRSARLRRRASVCLHRMPVSPPL